METKLKKQRNRLFLKIILIMLAVWLTLSAVFCVIRLIIERSNAQSKALADFTLIKQAMTDNFGAADSMNDAYLNGLGYLYDKNDPKQSFDSQVLLTDRRTGKTIIDSADCIGVRFNFRQEKTSVPVVGLLNYHAVRDPLSDEDFQTVKDYLSTVRDDGNRYELICTKLQLDFEITPLEVKIVLVSGSDPRMTIDDNVATYDLSANYIDSRQTYAAGSASRNTIPDSFLLDGKYMKDHIGALTEEQRGQSADMIHLKGFEYLCYASDYINYSDEEYYEIIESWRIQYARQVDLFQNCKTDLALGILISFAFILTVSIILCLMVWNTVKVQIIQEQKRLDLTNALAHDIKTPLFVISGYAYSLKEDIDETERDEYLDRIIEQTDEVNGLIHRMLDFSKLDSYSMTLHKTDFDLCETARKIADNYKALPDHKSIVITHSGDNTVNADQELVKTALQNLTDNAVKYALPDSEITIDITDKQFSIGNKTEPLTPSELKNLRQPYMRRDKSRHTKGNGLGLSIVQSIAEQHNARFDMEMKGSILTCTLRFRT